MAAHRIIVDGLSVRVDQSAQRSSSIPLTLPVTLAIKSSNARFALDRLATLSPQIIATNGQVNQAIVGFNDAQAAEQALRSFNGFALDGLPINLRPEFAPAPMPELPVAQSYYVFVGDLAPDVTDELLAAAFANFHSVSDLRVICDRNGSKGFGFVTFGDWNEAHASIATMNGEFLAGRPIRVNWANAKPGQTVLSAPSGSRRPSAASRAPGTMTRSGSSSSEALSFTASSRSSSLFSFEDNSAQQSNSTVYVGNLMPSTTPGDLAQLFASYGAMLECRMQHQRGFAFVRLATHEAAAAAIAELQGVMLHGRPLKTQWGRERVTGAAQQPTPPRTTPLPVNLLQTWPPVLQQQPMLPTFMPNNQTNFSPLTMPSTSPYNSY